MYQVLRSPFRITWPDVFFRRSMRCGLKKIDLPVVWLDFRLFIFGRMVFYNMATNEKPDAGPSSVVLFYMLVCFPHRGVGIVAETETTPPTFLFCCMTRAPDRWIIGHFRPAIDRIKNLLDFCAFFPSALKGACVYSYKFTLLTHCTRFHSRRSFRVIRRAGTASVEE